MKKYSYDENGFTFHRISKKEARNVYNNGLTVLLCPVNLRPGKPYNPEIHINKKCYDREFETLLNNFEYYNCINSETGKYTAFYIPVREIDRFTGEAPTAATLGTVAEYDYKYMEV